MERTLIQEAIEAIRQQIDPDSTILLQLDDARLNDIQGLLSGYELNRSRKVTILACCMLINLAIDKHHTLIQEENDRLTKRILDGDYLIGFYYRFAMKRNEFKLLSHLTSFNKRMQLKLMNGAKANALLSDLKTEIETYLERQTA